MGQFARRNPPVTRNRVAAVLRAVRPAAIRKLIIPQQDTTMRTQKKNISPDSLISNIRQWPEKLHWLDPLPLTHRWGIFIGLLLIITGFLLPGQSTQFPVQRSVNTSQAIMQAQLDNSSDSSSSLPAPSSDDPQGQWHNYQISDGQTLAQLFRDNNLPVSDVFAMANAEGTDKPLSNLQAGQQIRLQINARGTVTALTLNNSNGPVLFTRQSNGSFIRAQ